MKSSNPLSSSQKRRRTAIVIASVLVAAMLLTGTFAWQSIGQLALNQAMGNPGPAGGRLHDDFEVIGQNFGQREWAVNVSANKDVYIENFEYANDVDEDGDPIIGPDGRPVQIGRDIFARIRLYEYMEIGPGANLNPGEEDYDAREAVSIIDGADRGAFNTWSPRLPGANPTSDIFRSIWSWTMGGQKDYMPTFNKDNMSKETDVKGDAVDPQPLQIGEVINTTRRDAGIPRSAEEPPIGIAAYDADAGTHNYFTENPTHEAQVKFWDRDNESHAITTIDWEHTARPTLNATTMTMAQWISAGSNPGPVWVIDVDGWAYWAQPLAPETATGLLLNSITLINEPDDEWYYGIYIDAQMATAGDWTAESDNGGWYADDRSPSSDAENLMQIITGRTPAVFGVYLNETTATVSVDETLQLVATVVLENTNAADWMQVTWSISPAVDNESFVRHNGEFSPTAAHAGQWFTITATSVMDNTKYATARIYVPPMGQGVVVGDDGHVYHLGLGHNVYQRVLDDGTLGPMLVPVVPGRPGNLSDRTNVIEHNGFFYLDNGNGMFWGYSNGTVSDEDGLLGTGDDILFRLVEGNMVPADTDVQLSVTPATATIVRGNSQIFNATATLNADDLSSEVRWALVGNPSGVTLSTTAGPTTTVEVDSRRTPGNITLRASVGTVVRNVTISVIELQSFTVAGNKISLVHVDGVRFYGNDTNQVFRIDGTTATRIASPPAARASWNTNLFSWNNRLFAISNDRFVYEYNMAANTWSIFMTFPAGTPAISDSSITVIGDFAYVTNITGTNATGSERRSAAIIDLNARTMNYMPNFFANAHGWIHAVRYEHFIYVFAGYNGSTTGSRLVERWDTRTNTVQTTANNLPATSSTNAYLIQAVRVSNTETVLVFSNSFMRLDLVTGTLTATTTAPFANVNRSRNVGATGNNNTIYIDTSSRLHEIMR